MEIFPFLSFPSVVTDGILKKLTPYELFSLSLHSEEARNIVKRFSSSHKFQMEIDNNCDRLIFNYENEKKNDLYLLACPQSEPMDHILKFDGLPDNVLADIRHSGNYTMVRACFKRKQRGQRFQFLIEYMAKVFKNISIKIDCGVKGRAITYLPRNWTEKDKEKMIREQLKSVNIIKDTIKKCNFNIRSYRDVSYTHTFKELEQLITCGRLKVLKCHLTLEKLKKLFDKWMKLPNPGKIVLGKFKDDFKLGDLLPGNAIETEDTRFGPEPYVVVTRADGIKASIQLRNKKLTFEII